jgi:predicted 3-demethylubiquinone-9 3-methyltransferase (glyoxalase superfamily)
MPKKAAPFLMFEGRAEEAMNFYVSVFRGARIDRITRYGAGGPGREGSVVRATMSLAGLEVMCTDSPIQHGFTFTPSTSFFIECENMAEIDALFGKLSDGGVVMMPPDNYGFSQKFAWVADKFGVSWQLNLGS